jgi:predicted membrane-bound mannosyltransferase
MRLFQLGAGPLSEVEAGWALQALGVAHGQAQSLGAQPAYIILTSQLFSIISDSNFLARLYPAIAGSLLVWLPFFFRRSMGMSTWLHRAGLVMAFGLAIDPGLVSLSRQVGSPIPALAFTLLALACLYNRHMVWMGIAAGLALLSGPAFLQGLLILGISWGLYRLVRRNSTHR